VRQGRAPRHRQGAEAVRRDGARLVALAAFAIGVLIALALAGPATAADPLLPDLRQETPYALGVQTDGRRYHLGFASVVYNYGDGPLRIEGSRSSTQEPEMTAVQVVDSSDGSHSRVEAVGRMRYVDAITHRHWHYERFDTYSLRLPDGSLARPDPKTGFCLGDRLVAPPLATLPAMPPAAVYTGGCGYDAPDLLHVEEGISVGYGDDYQPQVEGQFVDITGLPAGRYVLVHTVNADGALREKSMADNAASVLLDVRWRGGRPRVTRLARCPLSATCPVAPALTTRRATRFAREALRQSYGVRAARIACQAPVSNRATCDWDEGQVTVAYSVSRARLYWRWTATRQGGRTLRGHVGVPFERRLPVQVEPRGAAATAALRRGYCPLIASG
jgi:hypothetical protein